MMHSGAKPRGLLARLRRIRPHDLALLVVALTEVVRTRLLLTLRKTGQIRGRIAQTLQSGKGRAPLVMTPQQRRAAFAEVAWSVAASARLVPQATCLTQAFSAQRLLALRGIDAVVHLTVPKDASDRKSTRLNSSHH